LDAFTNQTKKNNMADITIDCASGLEMTTYPCVSKDYGYPVKLVIGHTEGTLAVAGETPTLAEIQVGIAASGIDKLIVIEEITNGVKSENALEEESGADSADGLRSVFGVNIEIAGKIKLLDESVREELARLALYNRIRVWVITSGGWIFGGDKGYKVANFISPMYSDGFGSRPYYNFSFIYKHNMNATDPAREDDGFLDLVNSATT
jgi:hypothetical protein